LSPQRCRDLEVTEDRVADTLDHLARVRPHEAARLRARAQRARLYAGRERAQAALYRSAPGTTHVLDLSRYKK